MWRRTRVVSAGPRMTQGSPSAHLGSCADRAVFTRAPAPHGNERTKIGGGSVRFGVGDSVFKVGEGKRFKVGGGNAAWSSTWRRITRVERMLRFDPGRVIVVSNRMVTVSSPRRVIMYSMARTVIRASSPRLASSARLIADLTFASRISDGNDQSGSHCRTGRSRSSVSLTRHSRSGPGNGRLGPHVVGIDPHVVGIEPRRAISSAARCIPGRRIIVARIADSAGPDVTSRWECLRVGERKRPITRRLRASEVKVARVATTR